MSVKLSDVFTGAELQLAQISMAKATAGCPVFFGLDESNAIAGLSSTIGRKVSLCCFSTDLSLLCGQSALEQARVSGGHISDTHKCRCGAFYSWVNLILHNETVGYCQIRTAEALSPGNSHLLASYLRTLTSIGAMRLAQNQLRGSNPDQFVSLDPHHLYGHPNFLPLIRMISEAGRSLLHAGRCLYFSYDSSSQALCCEFASDLSQEQVSAILFSLQEFPPARQAMETFQPIMQDRQSISPTVSARLRHVFGDERFAVLPIWVVGHILGFLVFTATKTQPDRSSGSLSLADFGQAASNLLAVLGYRLESVSDSQDTPAQVGIIQRYAAMGQMAAELGHDIQASLYGMKNYAYLLSKGVKDDPRKATYTRAISEGIAYIERLSSEMRKLTGEPRQVALSPTDLCKVIDSAVLLMSPMALERGIKITKHYAEAIPILMADPVALTEVFLNLGLNAIHSMSHGGEISITVEPKGDKVFATFKDNGSGITEEILKRFWNNSSYAARSFTNKGLFIVQRIIRQLHGVIDVETQPGIGTSFFIELWVNPNVSVPKTEAEKRIPPSYLPPPADAPAGSALTNDNT